MIKKYQTLHSHTTISDGLLSHKEVLDVCLKNNTGVVAFTEHDTVPDKKTYQTLKNYQEHETKWIIGIEMSSGWPLDLGGGGTTNLHIVGLFVDPFNIALKNYCSKAQEARVIRMQRMVKNLQGLGLKITEKDCLTASGGEAIGRPHIVMALNFHQENKAIYENLKNKMAKEANSDEKIDKKYKEMIARGEGQYPYMLFLSDDAFIKDVFVDYLYYLDFDKSVSLLRNAGGIAILAHWFSCRYKMNEEYIEKVFSENRLDGAETVYGLFKKKSGQWEEQEKEIEILKKLVDKHSKLHSGGADAHSKDDFMEFAREKWYSERTVSLAENIIKKTKVDIKWSSFIK